MSAAFGSLSLPSVIYLSVLKPREVRASVVISTILLSRQKQLGTIANMPNLLAPARGSFSINERGYVSGYVSMNDRRPVGLSRWFCHFGDECGRPVWCLACTVDSPWRRFLENSPGNLMGQDETQFRKLPWTFVDVSLAHLWRTKEILPDFLPIHATSHSSYYRYYVVFRGGRWPRYFSNFILCEKSHKFTRKLHVVR